MNTKSGYTEARIEHIAEMMRNLTFRRGTTVKELASTWKIHLKTVKGMSAIASKRVLAELTDPARVTLNIGAHLQAVMEEAYRAGDRKSVIAAGRAWGDITLGRKYQVTTRAVDTLSDEELTRLASEAMSKLPK